LALESDSSPEPFSSAVTESGLYERAVAASTGLDEAVSSHLLSKFVVGSHVYQQLVLAGDNGASSVPTNRTQKMFLVLKAFTPLHTRESAQAEAQHLNMWAINVAELHTLDPTLEALSGTFRAASQRLAVHGLGLPMDEIEFLLCCFARSKLEGPWYVTNGAQLDALLVATRNAVGPGRLENLRSTVSRLDQQHVAKGGLDVSNFPTGAFLSGPGATKGASVGPHLHGKALHGGTNPTRTVSDDSILCLKCYETGHFKSACPNAVVCRHCSQAGHISPNCPHSAKPPQPPLNYVAGGTGLRGP